MFMGLIMESGCYLDSIWADSMSGEWIVHMCEYVRNMSSIRSCEWQERLEDMF